MKLAIALIVSLRFAVNIDYVKEAEKYAYPTICIGEKQKCS